MRELTKQKRKLFGDERHRRAAILFVLAALVFQPQADVSAAPVEELEFRCPKAYQGIKSDMLPTYWEPTDSGEGLGAGQSHVQGQYLVCIYRKPGGKKIGNVRRLAPKGYRCITDGKGTFQCERRQ